MKPWALVATCIAFAMPCHAWAQPVVPPGGTPTPEVTWETGVQPGFIRSVGFAEHTPDTPVRMRGIRPDLGPVYAWKGTRSEEHTSELQSLMRTSYAVFCLKKNPNHIKLHTPS